MFPLTGQAILAPAFLSHSHLSSIVLLVGVRWCVFCNNSPRWAEQLSTFALAVLNASKPGGTPLALRAWSTSQTCLTFRLAISCKPLDELQTGRNFVQKMGSWHVGLLRLGCGQIYVQFSRRALGAAVRGRACCCPMSQLCVQGSCPQASGM